MIDLNTEKDLAVRANYIKFLEDKISLFKNEPFFDRIQKEYPWLSAKLYDISRYIEVSKGDIGEVEISPK